MQNYRKKNYDPSTVKIPFIRITEKTSTCYSSQGTENKQQSVAKLNENVQPAKIRPPIFILKQLQEGRICSTISKDVPPQKAQKVKENRPEQQNIPSNSSAKPLTSLKAQVIKEDRLEQQKILSEVAPQGAKAINNNRPKKQQHILPKVSETSTLNNAPSNLIPQHAEILFSSYNPNIRTPQEVESKKTAALNSAQGAFQPRTPHSQISLGLTQQQQQMQRLQQQEIIQVLVHSDNAHVLSPILPQGAIRIPQFSNNANAIAPSQQQQQLQQQHQQFLLQRQQQLQIQQQAQKNSQVLQGASMVAIPEVVQQQPSTAPVIIQEGRTASTQLQQMNSKRKSPEILIQQQHNLNTTSNAIQVLNPQVVDQIVPQSPCAITNCPPSLVKRVKLPARTTLNLVGYNPSLKLPTENLLKGCTFFIVEYGENNGKKAPKWVELIQMYGGEIETAYCQKVTHVLSRTQQPDVVIQAIRDSKTCVTVYWLVGVLQRKQVFPPSHPLHLPTPRSFVLKDTDDIENLSFAFIEHLYSDVLHGQSAKTWHIPTDNSTENLSEIPQCENAIYQQCVSSTPPCETHSSTITHPMASQQFKRIQLKRPTVPEPDRQEIIQLADLPKRPKNSPSENIAENIICKKLPNTGNVSKVTYEAATLNKIAQPGSRSNNEAAMTIIPSDAIATEPSAAGILQEIPDLQQQQQKRRASTTISDPTQVVGQIAPGQQIVLPQSPGAVIKSARYSSVRAPLPAHEFLLGCTFFIVENDESNGNEMPNWEELIRKYGGETENVYCQKVTHVLCRSQRHGVVIQAIRDSERCVTTYWLSDVVQKKQVLPPCQPIHLPMLSTFGAQKVATKYIIAISGFENDDRERIKKIIEEVGGKLTRYMSKHNTVLICRRPEGPKYKKAKEWNIPVINTTWLNDIVIGNSRGISQYESAIYQQYNLTGPPFKIDYALLTHLMGHLKAPINRTQKTNEGLKRALLVPPIEPEPKRLKIAPLEDIPENIICKELPDANSVPKVVLSQVENMEGLKRAVTSLGGIVCDEPEFLNATHLVMTHIGRSSKFIRALCVVNYVIKSDWLVESANAGKFLPLDNYRIKDSKLEIEFNFTIEKVLQSSIRRSLFTGKIFYITPNIPPNKFEIFKMIKMCGGELDLSAHQLVSIMKAGPKTQQPNNYFIITCKKDLHIFGDLNMQEKLRPLLFSSELVMSSILHQSLQNSTPI